jgi:hypothetical protein
LDYLLKDINGYDCVVGSATDMVKGKNLFTNWLQSERYNIRSASLLVRREYFDNNNFDYSEKNYVIPGAAAQGIAPTIIFSSVGNRPDHSLYKKLFFIFPRLPKFHNHWHK